MSKTCYKKGIGSTMMELDIYRDMNLNIDTDCPSGWAENVESTYGYQGPLDCGDLKGELNCYKCDGNNRQRVSMCVPPNADVGCGEGYDTYPIKCNHPSSADIGAPQPISYDRQYCACQESDGTVTGYSPLCCTTNNLVPNPYNPYARPDGGRPAYPTRPYTPAPKTAGISSVPWYGWVVIGLGVAYFLKVNAKKNK
tara:strand:- start:3074 stop:3664 length:591 start_codon:yes stop_codon:yes gene_type:complete